MSSSIPFVFKSTPSFSFDTETTLPCYECSISGYGIACQDCSRSSPASGNTFSFSFTFPLANMVPSLQMPFSPEFPSATNQSYSDWPGIEAAEPSTKKSRFNWSEIECSKGEHLFTGVTANHKPAQTSVTEKHSSLVSQKQPSDCLFCSMVPYGAECIDCNQIKTSKAISFATPPAAAWPATHQLGNWEGTKAIEEELLQNLDMELFEQINVPHELDEWGRRVYNDCGHRILYYQDADGNTIIGYEASYPSSVIDDYEEPSDWHPDEQTDESPAKNELSHAESNDCKDRNIIYVDSDENSDITGFEAWYPSSIIDDYRTGRQIDSSPANQEAPHAQHNSCGDRNIIYLDSDDEESVITFTGYSAWYPSSATSKGNKNPKLEIEQRRFAEFLAAQDDELPQFASDRERVAAWIGASSILEDEDEDEDEGSVLDYRTADLVAQWWAGFEGWEDVSGSEVEGCFSVDSVSEKWYDAVSVCG